MRITRKPILTIVSVHSQRSRREIRRASLSFWSLFIRNTIQRVPSWLLLSVTFLASAETIHHPNMSKRKVDEEVVQDEEESIPGEDEDVEEESEGDDDSTTGEENEESMDDMINVEFEALPPEEED